MKGRYTERKRSSICWFIVQIVTTARARPGQSQEPRIPSELQTSMTGVQKLGLSSVASLSSLPGSEAARTQTGTPMGVGRWCFNASATTMSPARFQKSLIFFKHGERSPFWSTKVLKSLHLLQLPPNLFSCAHFPSLPSDNTDKEQQVKKGGWGRRWERIEEDKKIQRAFRFLEEKRVQD